MSMAMESNNICNSMGFCLMLMVLLLLIMLVPPATSDFSHDKKQCQKQLLNLSPCLAYVSGSDDKPTSSCCIQLQKDEANSRVCLCILVRDRNEPALGFKLNATLALNLIPTCHIHSNATASTCPELLHLAPNSPEAQIFQQFGNVSSGASAAAGGETTTSPSSSSSSNAVWSFGRKPTGQAAINIGGSLIWVVVSVAIFST